MTYRMACDLKTHTIVWVYGDQNTQNNCIELSAKLRGY